MGNLSLYLVQTKKRVPKIAAGKQRSILSLLSSSARLEAVEMSIENPPLTVNALFIRDTPLPARKPEMTGVGMKFVHASARSLQRRQNASPTPTLMVKINARTDGHIIAFSGRSAASDATAAAVMGMS